MRVLFTNNTLGPRAGTELYVLDVARRLKVLGHEPVAYSPVIGDVAELLRASGIPVLINLAELPFRPDIIHGHHHLETMTAVLSLPGVPSVYFCHGVIPWEEMPPVFPRIFRHAAVSTGCRDRVTKDTAIPQERVRIILNFVDTQVFQPRETLPSQPRRALVFSNYASEQNYAATVREACIAAGLEVDIRGATVGNAASEPEKLLPQYDLVFAKGRAALEAMAVGCAVVLCDAKGYGPMVSSRNFADLRPLNFGLGALREPVTVEALAPAIAAYDSDDAVRVRDLVRTQAGMEDAVDQIVRLYEEVIAESALHFPDPVAEIRAAGAYLQTLDSSLKGAYYGTPTILPPAMPPEALALPPERKSSLLERLLGMERKRRRPGSSHPPP